MTPQELTERRAEGLLRLLRQRQNLTRHLLLVLRLSMCVNERAATNGVQAPYNWDVQPAWARGFSSLPRWEDIGPAWPLTEAQRQEWPHGWPARDEQSPPSSETDNNWTSVEAKSTSVDPVCIRKGI
ncbi:hypothetical protein BJ912DRAFT_1057979 [Pholiota molesta]|nr:hypothetical protein BJ912DRAFT_1057979 [Pholiota molesta]